MRRINQFILGTSLLVSALLIPPAQGQLPLGPSVQSANHFTESGRIARVDLKHNEIVIGDSTRKLSSDIRLYAPNGDSIPLESLKRGMNIDFNIAMDQETHVPMVTEILILPSK